jgi:MFS family permease
LIPALLRQRLFRRYWIGQTVSLFGDQVTLIAMPLVAVLVLDAGPAQMGYLVAAELAPNLLFSLHAGALIDRRGHRREAMIVTDLARAALIATVPIAYAFDSLSMEQLYVVAFLTGTLTVVFQVASASLFSTLVRREE